MKADKSMVRIFNLANDITDLLNKNNSSLYEKLFAVELVKVGTTSHVGEMFLEMKLKERPKI